MQAISSVINAVKDGYLAAIQWVDDNPQKTLWLALAALILALVF